MMIRSITCFYRGLNNRGLNNRGLNNRGLNNCVATPLFRKFSFLPERVRGGDVEIGVLEGVLRLSPLVNAIIWPFSISY